MTPLSFGGSTPVVGLDIGADHIRAAQLRAASGGFQLTGYASAPLPLGAVVEGEVLDVDAVSRALSQLWKQGGLHGRDVTVGVSNQKVVVRLIDLPYMERAELQGAIQYQAQDYIPIPIEEAIIDFQIIGDYMTPSDEHMMEVLLVAAQRDMIDNVVAAVEGARLRLVDIDVTSFALVRALLGLVPSVLPEESDDSGEATGIIHMSSGLTNIIVVERNVPRFTRVSSLAGNQFTQAIASMLNLTFDEAEQLKISVGLPAMDGSSASADPTVTRAQEALEREVNKFIAEVRRSLDYYLTQTTQARSIRRIWLTGSGASITNLASYLEQGLQTQVLIGDPLAYVKPDASVGAAIEADRMGAAPAIGLAMGERA